MAVEKTAVISGSDLQNAQASQGEWSNTVVAFSLRVGAADRFGNFNPRAHRQADADRAGREDQVGAGDPGRDPHQRPDRRGTSRRRRPTSCPWSCAPARCRRILTLEERTVGPSLGRDSIRDGLRAAAFGALFTCVFMLIYYKLAGINAIVALGLNMLILFASMAQMGRR